MVQHPRLAAWDARIQQWVDRQYGRRPLIVLIVFAVLAVLGIATVYWIDDTALPRIGHVIKAGASLPTGIFGLLFVVLLFVLIGFAFFDTSPNAAVLKAWLGSRKGSTVPPHPPPPPSLTAAQEEEIQLLREVWTRWVVSSAAALLQLFGDVARNVQETKYWGLLLDIKGVNLEAAIKEMKAALATNTMPPDEVRAQFQETYGNYLLACRWLSRIDKHEFKLEERHKEKLEEWRSRHRKCFDRLRGLQTHPAYAGVLLIDTDFRGERYYVDFMLAAGHTFE